MFSKHNKHHFFLVGFHQNKLEIGNVPLACNIWETSEKLHSLWVTSLIVDWQNQHREPQHESKHVYIITFVWQSRLKMKMRNYICDNVDLQCTRMFTITLKYLERTICTSLFSLSILYVRVWASITLMHTFFK